MEEEKPNISIEEAEKIGCAAAGDFTWNFQRLLSAGHYEKARCLVLTAFVYVLASVDPSRRSALLSDISDMYQRIGKVAFEDGEDLYDFLCNNKGN